MSHPPVASLRLLGGCHLGGERGGDDDARPGTATATQLKRLALLGYLACTVSAPPTRERLCALFWPELDDQGSRHALRQALYALRQRLGHDALVTRGPSVSLDTARVSCDVVHFEHAVAAGRHLDAIALYGGELMDGVHVAGAASEFEAWLDANRQRLRDLAARAAVAASYDLAMTGELAESERLVALAEGLRPFDEALVQRRMTLLAEQGNRGAALECYAQLVTRLRAQLDVDPSPATRALAARLASLAEDNAPPVQPVAASPAATAPVLVADRRLPAETDASDHPSAAGPVAGSGAPVRRRRGRVLAYVASVATASAALAALVWATGRGVDPLRARTRAPALTPPAVASRDLIARGNAAYCRGELEGATSLLSSASASDSTDPVAWYYQSVVLKAQGRDVDRARALQRAMRGAAPSRANTPAEVGMLARADWAETTNDRGWRNIAESLAVRFPSHGPAIAAHARALVWSGEFASARALLHAAARRHDLVLSPPICHSTDLLAQAINAAMLVDSLDAAEREVREWLHESPTSQEAHYLLAAVLQRQGRISESLLARQASLRNASGVIDDAMSRTELAIRDGRFDEAEQLLRMRTQDARLEVHGEAQWWTTILLRERGQLRAAIESARRARVMATRDEGADVGLGVAVLEAQSLQEAGRWREAAALFDTIANAPASALERSLPPGNGVTARRVTWALTHRAAAVAVGGDTIALRTLADTIRTLGARSAFGRDQRLHHHLLGELLVARGDTTSAINELLQSIYSRTGGYTRTNLVLGRLLVARGRASEAVTLLEAALRGALDGSAMYTTRSELHEALGDALLAAGRAAEARPHYALVADAWREAETPYRERGRRARALSAPSAATRTGDGE